MKKKKKFTIEEIKNNVVKNTNKIWIPNYNINFNNKSINKYHDIKVAINNDTIVKNYFKIKCDVLDEKNIKSKKVKLVLTKRQKKIIDSWLHGYKEVYNKTIHYIKHNYLNENFTLRWETIRDNIKPFIRNIASNHCDVKIHDLCYAVKLVCQNYKSALSNYKNGNIKKFRMRYWKNNKDSKIIDLEKQDFESGSIRKNILGEVKGYYNGNKFNFTEIDKDCRLRKDILLNTYTLFVPINGDEIEYKNRDNFISLDPGIRTFMTGLSENKVVKIGDNNIQ